MNLVGTEVGSEGAKVQEEIVEEVEFLGGGQVAWARVDLRG